MNPAHLDYDVLADLAEGLLEDDQAASVNAHLESCAECRDRSADLADVSRILAEAPVPSMPPELAERIDTAIAAESMHSATVVSMEQRRGRRHWRILSAAAATIVVLGGGATVGKIALDDSDGSGSQAATPPQDRARQHSAGGAAPNAAAPSESTMVKGAYKVTRSGTEYRAGRLGGQVDRLLGKGQELRLQGSAPSGAVSGCVAGVTRGRTPALVDRARYDGRDAIVIALPGAKDGGWDVWVVGPDCTAKDPHVLEHEPA
ncbi:anti-sigma factor family protein [Actinomadura violacea]|uniref:Zinc-finger domain-containing protein n=1 Tax=Actinomadura violacea TaxID=2819934 RepID=A0ABS3RXC6_9ACTN|nr:hypothetical protein [Actinomadura violacea]MBO2461301.1 hypothetical protein [Actinomadura violacea]